MKLFRVPLSLENISTPNIKILSSIKGYFGIEISFINNSLQLACLLNSKIVNKIMKSNSKKDLYIYFNIFGFSRIDYEHIELVDYDPLLDIDNTSKNILQLYLDFSETNFFNLPNKRNLIQNSKENLPNKEGNFPINNNFLKSVLTKLSELESNFIFQLYVTSKKSNYFLGGQLLYYYAPEEESNDFKSTFNFLKLFFSDYNINLQKPSWIQRKRGILLKFSKKHYPYKWFEKKHYILNYLLYLPNLKDLKTDLNIEICQRIFSKENLDLKESLPIGYKVIPGLHNPPIMNISFNDLTSHFSCFGLTSQGKSRLMYSLITFIDKTKKNFLVIDPKGEYFEALSGTNKEINYYKIGSLEFPLGLNIFHVPKGLSKEHHIQFLYSLLSSIMGDEVSPQMSRILFKAINYVVDINGNMLSFLNILENPKILNIKGSYLELSGTAIINRLIPLISGPAKNCFSSEDTTVNFFELIKCNSIIDLTNFEIIESTITRKIFVNTFLHYYLHAIRYTNSNLRQAGDITNFIFIEEIQKIAPLVYQGKNSVNSFIGISPWTVRAFGVCLGFIGTDPNVELPIITNTGISIVFYSKSNIENILKMLGISYSEYMKYHQDLKRRKRFLLSIKGEITLLESFNYEIPNGETIKKRYSEISNKHLDNIYAKNNILS